MSLQKLAANTVDDNMDMGSHQSRKDKNEWKFPFQRLEMTQFLKNMLKKNMLPHPSYQLHFFYFSTFMASLAAKQEE